MCSFAMLSGICPRVSGSAFLPVALLKYACMSGFPSQPSRLQGVEEMMSSGTLAGFPVVDVTATLYDGSFHDVDSSVLAFQIAARAAFREGMRKGAVRLLEPIMKA